MRPRPGRPRLDPAYAGQRPMKWASAPGKRAGLRRFADRAHYCATPWGKKTTVTTGWQVEEPPWRATRGT